MGIEPSVLAIGSEGQPTTRGSGVQTVTIAVDGTTVSFGTGLAAWGAVQMPSAITGTSLTVNYSNDNSNWTAVPTEGSETNPITVEADGTYRLPSWAFSAQYIQLKMDAQAAARTLTLFLKG